MRYWVWRPFAAAFAAILLFCGTAFAGLQVVTFNTALAKVFGIDLVSHVDLRIEPQIQSLERVLRPPFALLLQEVWTKKAQKAYREWAAKNGYQVASMGQNGNGLMIISSEPITSQAFYEFSKNTFRRHFGVLVALVNFEGHSVRIMDVHTNFSPVHEVSDVHRAQLAELAGLTRASWLPSILGGDLNVGPDLTYPRGNYDPAVEIWQKAFIDLMNPNWTWVGAKMLGSTWDETNNTLVSKPALSMRILKQLDEQKSWGYSDSKLDHLFLSEHFGVRSTRLVLNQPQMFDGIGVTYLSDHFGCEAILTELHPLYLK